MDSTPIVRVEEKIIREKISHPTAFILGSGRSGTTLLRVMLAGHPQLFSPPEMILNIFDTMEERQEYFKTRYWEKGGLRRAIMHLFDLDVEGAKEVEDSLSGFTISETYQWLHKALHGRTLIDKCVHMAMDSALLAKAEERFENPRYLWIIRHPASVIRSFENMPMAEVMLAGVAGGAEQFWINANRNIQTFLQKIPRNRWMMVVYEDLVNDPKPVMERACRTLGTPFDSAVLNPYEGDRMREGPKGARAIGDPNMASRGKIDSSLATSWLTGFDSSQASTELREFAASVGYDLDKLERPPITKVSAALDRLWDTAQELERSIKLPMDLDALEGRRFLMRMVSASWDMLVEEGDPDRPRFVHAESPIRKMFADNPDANYLRAPLKMGPGRIYRVKGRTWPETVYFAILLYGKGGRVAKQLRDDEITLTPLSSPVGAQFDVLISADPQPGNWLQADEDIEAVIVRQYYFDRNRERSIDLSIEYLGSPAEARALEPEGFTHRIDRSVRMLRSVWKRTMTSWELAHRAFLNQFGEVPAENLFPTPDNRYRICWYRFGYNQVMRVCGKLPKARYFNLSLVNAWMESYDYLSHTISLNSRQIKASADGSFEVILAHKNLGHPNWLDTAGHHAGYLIARYLCAEEEPTPLQISVQYEEEYLRTQA